LVKCEFLNYGPVSVVRDTFAMSVNTEYRIIQNIFEIRTNQTNIE